MRDNLSKTSGFGIGEAGSVPASTPEDDLEAARLERAALGPRPPRKLYLCNRCGCQTAEPMSSSQGTVCFDCYLELDNG